ncbi:hypothetical protein L484_014853 [Morus notabilis]|uniref:Uncharacterized protein n=1 Tax=Morus notabilis TaxID=981085 RepID=W9QPP7_9ROSA|nr:hypothetical protein L484_014853 [Morus notabilis]
MWVHVEGHDWADGTALGGVGIRQGRGQGLKVSCLGCLVGRWSHGQAHVLSKATSFCVRFPTDGDMNHPLPIGSWFARAIKNLSLATD